MTPTRFAEPFDSFVAPARVRPALWRLIAGVVIWAVCFAGFGVAFVAGISVVDPDLFMSELVFSGRTPSGLVSFLGIFVGAFAGVWLAAKLLHRRGLRSLIGPGPAMRNFAIAVAVYGGLQAISLTLWLVLNDSPQNVPLGLFLTWLPALVIVLLIQTGAEELLCRGYLMQQLAARFAAPWVWFVLPQLFFASLHYSPGAYGSMIWVVLLVIFVMALMWADLTRRTGNIGAAWGWHFTNNFIVFGVVGASEQLDGLSLWVSPYALADTPPLAYAFYFALMTLTWLILRRILRP